jgi:prepilin-type N-terminal cleavage/methylation domain-containing protein
MFRRSSRAAFTLIEVVITVVIIGIITSIAVPGYGAIVERQALRTTESRAVGFGNAAVALAQFDLGAVGIDHFTSVGLDEDAGRGICDVRLTEAGPTQMPGLEHSADHVSVVYNDPPYVVILRVHTTTLGVTSKAYRVGSSC